MLALPLTDAITLVLLLSFAVVFSIIYFRIRRSGQGPTLRPLPGVESLHGMSERAIEEGHRMHLALGTGRLTDVTTAETLMGIVVLDPLAEQAARTNQNPVVTTSDPVTQLLAADHLRGGEAERGWRTRTSARFVAPTPVAYGAGTRGMMQREGLGLTAAVGHFGDEYLFLAAERPGGGTELHAPELAATAQLETLPLVYLTARNPVLGEETFALGAYLGRWPSHLAGVVVQDLGRLVVIVAIVVGVALRTVGVF